MISQWGVKWILLLMPNPQRFPVPLHASFGFMLIAILGLVSHVNGVSANKYPWAVLSVASMLWPKLNRSALQSGAPLSGLVNIAFPDPRQFVALSFKYVRACGLSWGTLLPLLLEKLNCKILENEYPIDLSMFPSVSVLILAMLIVSGGTSAVLTVNPPRLRERCLEEVEAEVYQLHRVLVQV